jgi:O-antigen/teichoic acid export membrane protein
MRLLRRNVLTSYAVYAASLVSGLVVTTIVVHALGKTTYGVWAFIGSLGVWLGLLDLGVGPSIVRFAAEHRGRRAPEETSALASVGLVVYAVVGLVTIAAGVALAFLVPILVEVPDSLVEPARLATLVAVAGVAARFPLGLFGNLLAGQQRYDVINLGNLLSIVLYAVLVAVVMTQGGDLVALALISLGASLLRLAFPLLWLRRELPALALSRARVSRDRLRSLFGFSWHNFLIHASAKVVFSTDVIVVGIVLGAVPATFYGIPAKLFEIGFGATVAGTDLLYPAFAELEGAEQAARQRAYLRTGLRAGLVVALLVGLPLVFVPDLLITGWIGEGFGPSTTVMVLLALVLLVHQPAHVLAQFMIARARQSRLALTLVGVVTANLVLSIVLAWTVGLWGVALATLVTEATATLVLVPRLAVPASGLSYRDLARASLRPLPGALVVAAIVLVGVARAYDPSTLAALVPLGLLWIAAFVPAVYRFGLSQDERRALARQLGRRPPQALSQIEGEPG